MSTFTRFWHDLMRSNGEAACTGAGSITDLMISDADLMPRGDIICPADAVMIARATVRYLEREAEKPSSAPTMAHLLAMAEGARAVAVALGDDEE